VTTKRQLLRRIEALEAEVARLTQVARVLSTLRPSVSASGPKVHVEATLSNKAADALRVEVAKAHRLMRLS
jgi:hypothetical protein